MDIVGKLVRDLCALKKTSQSVVVSKGKFLPSSKEISIGTPFPVFAKETKGVGDFFAMVDLVRSCSDVRDKKVQVAKETLSKYFIGDKKVKQEILSKLVSQIEKII